MSTKKIGFGGGCHWCTEAVFDQLLGVKKVEQGWIASSQPHSAFSEAVIVHYDQEIIDLRTLTNIHLLTHASTSNHSMRGKYRSAIYSFSKEQHADVLAILNELKHEFEEPLITMVLPFKSFKPSDEQYQNYYQKNSDKPFCKTYIDPKLGLLMKQFRRHLKK